MMMSPSPIGDLHIQTCAEGQNWPSMLEIVDDVSNRSLLRHVDQVLIDDDLLAVVASRSHRHQLGFVKIILVTGAQGSCVRLHLWDNDSPIQEDVHSHCANFHSRVVVGSFVENAFALLTGNDYTHFRYHFDENLGHSVANTEGKTNIKLSRSRKLNTGDIYTKSAKDLHNVTLVSQGTITVSAWGTRDTEAVVLKTNGASAEDCSIQVGMSSTDLRNYLIRIKERMLTI
ncbi:MULTISPECIES: hypothetical protein [Pseudomonas]|uniref:hypothetical protein n=1 Tax=Pseudomonas TaxID=286 RepID=UPI0018E7E4A6|nr:hypothetical protein [Pseudomonas carnis]MBJ2213337.1 hypothetical protein [Pseudomonas carnis]